MTLNLRQPTDQELRDLAMTLAGEIDPSKSPYNDPQTRTEAANILAVVINRYSMGRPTMIGGYDVEEFNSYSDVVLTPEQFNAWSSSDIDRTRQNYSANTDFFHNIVLDFFDGELRPTFPDATHYHADHVNPRWATNLRKTENGLLGSTGPHIFYSDVEWTGRRIGTARPSYERAASIPPPNPIPRPDDFDAADEQRKIPDAQQNNQVGPDTIRRRLDQGFDRMDQDLGPPVVDPRFEPILNRLTPEQMEGLRTELDEVRAQNRRQSDYEASTLQERMARSLQGLRESGRPDDDLDDAGILNTLGEERFADYARQRDGARRYHHAVAGMESLPDQEIEARMVALRSAKAEPGDEGAALQSDVARHVLALRAERQTDPAMAVRRIPEMKRAESELNPDDRESVSAFVGEGLRWQAVQGLAPGAQRAVPRELAQTLADGILAQQADARRDGVRPAVAMRASIDGIRNVFGDAHARSVMNSAFAEMRGADHLASMARHMFDRDEMGGMMSPAVPQMMPPVAYGQGAGRPALKPMGRAV